MRTLCNHLATLITIALLLPLPFSAYAFSTEPSAQQIDRMTDAVIQAYPLEQMITLIEAKDPNFPMATTPSKEAAAKLSCVRKRLLSYPLRAWKRDEVIEYSKSNSDRFDEDLKIVEIAAPAIGKALTTGFLTMASKKEADFEEAMSSVTTDQMTAAAKVIKNPDMAPLRDLIGIGGINDSGASERKDRNLDAIFGRSGARLLNAVMKDCDVTPGSLK